ncbi:MAG TPA: O-antigen ligase family protein [Vicinamibacterales bacterium]|nr:O-antigen ligase family protein [Vicinamibacterales bacterium]
MNAITDAVPRMETTGTLERATFVLLLAFVTAVQLSIAAAEILLVITLSCWALLLARDHVRPSAPSFFLPLTVYGAATLISSAFSLDPLASFEDSRQLLLFAIVPLVYGVAGRGRAAIVITVIVSVGALSAAFGIVQYALFHYDTLGRRPEGALTHYMTYSGTLMLVVCAAAARLVFGVRERTWPALVMPAVVVALALTLTRGTWVGACVAVGLLLVLRDFRLTALLPVVIALFFALAPETVTDRMVSIFDLRDPSNRDRLAMLHAGAEMVRADPLTGVGPDMIPRVYGQYRDPDAVNATNPHLHNVPLQIAAERGLPALAVWLWFIAVCCAGLFGLVRRQADKTLPAAGLAAVAAMLAAGLFEYNFGDSEFLMLFLVMITLPFADAKPWQDPTSAKATVGRRAAIDSSL